MEAGVDGSGDAGGGPVAVDAVLFIPNEAALSGDDTGFAIWAEGVTEEFFGVAEAVDIGDVEKVDPVIESEADRGAPFRFVDGAVIVAGSGAAAEAEP